MDLDAEPASTVSPRRSAMAKANLECSRLWYATRAPSCGASKTLCPMIIVAFRGRFRWRIAHSAPRSPALGPAARLMAGPVGIRFEEASPFESLAGSQDPSDSVPAVVAALRRIRQNDSCIKSVSALESGDGFPALQGDDPWF